MVGLGGLAILLPALIWGGTLAVEIILPLALVVCVEEYARMASPERYPRALAVLGLGVAAVYALPLYVGPEAAFPAFVLAGLLAFVSVLFTVGPTLERAADDVARLMLGVVWIGGCGASLVHVRRAEDGLIWLIALLAIPWGGDTGGYFAGKYLGNSKMYPLVSPKKTWAGFVGGLAASVLALFVLRSIAGVLTPLDCVLLGLVLGVAGVVGDLSESLLKRAFNVKDSGSILPGHGGMLDRIDSVLFVAPLLYVYILWVKGA